MHLHTPTRGIVAVQANAGNDVTALIGQIKTGFEQFKARHDGSLSEIRSQIADLATKHASIGLNGGMPAGPIEGQRREVSAALRSYIKSGDVDGINAMLVNAGMSVGSDPDGGYTVYPTLSAQMTKRVFELSPMRRIARVVPVSSDSFEEIADLEEGEASWVGETQARPDTATPKLGMLRIPVHEIFAQPKITQKLLDDSEIDLAAWLVEKCAQRFARKEGAAFVAGDGQLKPRGILTYPTAATADASRPWGTIEHVNTGASGAFGSSTAATDSLIDLTYRLKVAFRPNARWLMNRTTAGVVRKLKDGDGNYIWQASAALGEPDRLLGFPVELDEEMPAIASNSLSIAFGDFREGYTIVDRHGLRLLRDPFTDKPNVRFYTYKRLGGDVSNFEAIKLLRFGTT